MGSLQGAVTMVPFGDSASVVARSAAASSPAALLHRPAGHRR